MPPIRQLPQAVINKIAAGEVIERPASVVKELIENSIDAGARRVDLSVEAGGLEMIRVADSGCGIEIEQLPLAIAAHATSKIRDADDLFSVRTLGFRGEALASIAEVSHFTLRSRATTSDAGGELEVIGGSVRGPVPAGCPVGTTIEVRNLFFNTPVRRKFLKTAQTEFGHCSEAFTRVALAHPDVHFTLRHNERTIYDLPPVENWRERILAFYRAEIGDSLIWVESTDEEVRVHGFVADPSVSRANNRMQYLFLNGRNIRDRSLQHALTEAYRGLLMVGRFPVAFLKLEMPPSAVDVNVHPTKLEVRFQDSGRLYSQLLGALRKRFLSTDLTAKAQLHDPRTDAAHQELAPSSRSAEPAAAAIDRQHFSEHQRALMDWARGPSAPTSPPASVSSSFGSGVVPSFRPFPAPQFVPGAISAPGIPPAAQTPPATESPLPPGTPPAAADRTAADRTVAADEAFAPSRPQTGIQLQNRYLVTEGEDGIVIIDQHALHERILYEQLRERVLGGRVETQQLLVPEPVHLTAAEASAALDSADELAQLGIRIEPFGGDTVLVTSYPAMLANISPGEILRQVIEQLLAGGRSPDRRVLLDELLHMVACKAAVKAGDRLAPDEVTELLKLRHLCHDAHHCPHGRPTALVFSRDELDKRFKRI